MFKLALVILVTVLVASTFGQSWEGKYTFSGSVYRINSGVLYICERDNLLYGAYGATEDEPVGYFTLTKTNATFASGPIYEVTAAVNTPSYLTGTLDFTFNSGSGAFSANRLIPNNGSVLTGTRTNSSLVDNTFCLYSNYSSFAPANFSGFWNLNLDGTISSTENETLCIGGSATIGSTYYFFDPVAGLVPGTSNNTVTDGGFRMIGRYCDSECGGQIYHLTDANTFFNYFFAQNGLFGAKQGKTRNIDYITQTVGQQCLAVRVASGAAQIAAGMLAFVLAIASSVFLFV
jgi:hypothetical protein